MGHSVLVVEGADDMRALVVTGLQRAGMDTFEATSGSECLAQVRESHPDLVVLDLGLPDAEGTEVCRQLRTMSNCYVLMLSGSPEEVDVLIGLAVGADGYMVKPFSPRELTARVQTMLRRVRHQPQTPVADSPQRRSTDDAQPRRRSTDRGAEVSNVARVGDLEVDLDTREVRIATTQVPVTRTEFDLLAMLASNPGRVFQRETLLQGVWHSEWEGDARLVEVHMSNLRRKLAAAGVVNPGIRTVRGVGYRLVL